MTITTVSVAAKIREIGITIITAIATNQRKCAYCTISKNTEAHAVPPRGTIPKSRIQKKSPFPICVNRFPF